MLKQNPFTAYKTMFVGVFGDNTIVSFRDTAILLCIALALTPAFKMRFWNIGAEGQVIAGALASAFCLYNFYSLPTPLLIIVMFLASSLFGALWGAIPAIFKAYWGTNETLFTLMMNYVAIQLISTFVTDFIIKSGQNSIGSNVLKHGWLPEIFGQQYLLNIVIVAILTVLMYIYLKYSKQGYEISVLGESERTARYAGIKPGKVIIRTMAISGAICGLAGFVAVAGADHTISTSTAGGRGFTAIIVAWLAQFNTFVMLLISLMLVFLQKGAVQIATDFKLNDFASNVITGIILFCIIASEFFINYRVIFRKRKEVPGK